MNSYLLESEDSLSLQKERENIIKKEKFQEATISYYDLVESSLDNALEDLDTYSFLSSKKVIIIRGIENIKYDDFKDEVEHLYKYIANPNPDCLLIIEAQKLNNTTKLAKDLKKKCQYQAIQIDAKKYMKQAFKDYKIDDDTLSLLEEYCLGDFTKIAVECDKLKTYKIDTKIIEKEDVLDLVVKKIGDSRDLTFAFSRSLALRDKKDALAKFQELTSYDMEPISIIGLLASQMRIIYQVKLLAQRYLSDREIANLLEEKSDYRIKKTRELINLYSEKELLQIMQTLSDMDFQLKTSDVDGKHLLEMFILNL